MASWISQAWNTGSSNQGNVPVNLEHIRIYPKKNHQKITPQHPQHNPEHSAYHTPPSAPLYLLKPPSSYLLKTPVSETPLTIPLRLVGTAPYRAVTSGTAIKHLHRAEPWMPSSCHRVPGTENTLPYPQAGPF